MASSSMNVGVNITDQGLSFTLTLCKGVCCDVKVHSFFVLFKKAHVVLIYAFIPRFTLFTENLYSSLSGRPLFASVMFISLAPHVIFTLSNKLIKGVSLFQPPHHTHRRSACQNIFKYLASFSHSSFPPTLRITYLFLLCPTWSIFAYFLGIFLHMNELVSLLHPRTPGFCSKHTHSTNKRNTHLWASVFHKLLVWNKAVYLIAVPGGNAIRWLAADSFWLPNPAIKMFNKPTKPWGIKWEWLWNTNVTYH